MGDASRGHPALPAHWHAPGGEPGCRAEVSAASRRMPAGAAGSAGRAAAAPAGRTAARRRHRAVSGVRRLETVLLKDPAATRPGEPGD